MRDKIGRAVFFITALGSFTGLFIGIILSITATPAEIAAEGKSPDVAHFDNVIVRAINPLFYFTYLSNLLVVIVCFMLAIQLRRASTGFRSFRLFSLVAIIVTGIVYNTLLADWSASHGWAFVSTFLLHVITPILSFFGWIILGPRLPFKMKYVWWSMVIGLAWIVVTFIRGAFIHWYPYFFLNADTLGLGPALLNTFGILVIAFILAVVIMALDKVLPGINIEREDEPKPETTSSA